MSHADRPGRLGAVSTGPVAKMRAAAARQVEPTHYRGLQYDSRLRFISYWHQIASVAKYRPRCVLEVGIGNGFVSEYLRKAGIEVVTLDFDPELSPSVAGQVQRLPFADRAFDLVLCSEVLEHLPLDMLPQALSELRRVTRAHVVLSVPNVEPCVRIILPVPRVGERCLLVRSWWRRRPRTVTDPREHYWELGIRSFSPRQFLALASEAGLVNLREQRIFDHPFHHFFEFAR